MIISLRALARDFYTDLRPEVRWLSGGYLLVCSSGFGQTYFIAVFAGVLKADLGLSDGMFGALYTVATLASALALTLCGQLADRYPVGKLGVATLIALALTAAGMAAASSVWMLALALFGLRFFGQGMLTNIAMTGMARWFRRKRGRAISIAALGFPTIEAVIPLAGVAMIGLIGWRMTWVATACVLTVVLAPAIAVLLKRERQPTPPPKADGSAATTDGEPLRRDWTRADVLRSGLFYALLPGVMAQPFIQTGIFFNQVTIVDFKGWDMLAFAASYPLMAAVNLTTALVAGWLVDRYTARRLLPLYIVPLGCASLLLGAGDGPYVMAGFMMLTGLTSGSASTVVSALWAELYGTRHLGAIRSFTVAVIVFATAVSPGLMGVLLDAGIGFDVQLPVMGVYCFVAAVWMAFLVPRMNRQVSEAHQSPAHQA